MRSVRFSRQSLERAKSRDKFPSLNVIQIGSRNARHFSASPYDYDQRSTGWTEEQEGFARQSIQATQRALENRRTRVTWTISGFVFDKHHMGFETRDPQIANGIMKIILDDFKRKINLSEDTQYKNTCPMLTGRQSIFQLFFVLEHHENSGAYKELERFAQCRVVNRQPQHVQPGLGTT